MGEIKKEAKSFFRRKIRGAKTFFQLKKGGRTLFFRKNKGTETFFRLKKRVAKTFFSQIFPKTWAMYPVNFDRSLMVEISFLSNFSQGPTRVPSNSEYFNLCQVPVRYHTCRQFFNFFSSMKVPVGSR